jgi:putative ABC transport system permease protein
MITPRWEKILADLGTNKTRTLLASLSIAVGIFAVGVVVTSYFLVRDAMNADYFTVNPRTARIYAELFDQSLVDQLASVEGVTSIEGHYDIWVKGTAADGRQYPVNLASIAPLGLQIVDRLVFEAGARTLGEQEIFFERAGAEGMGLVVGGTVDLLMRDGQTRTLKLAGIVHDVQSNPFKFNSQTSAYVTPETMKWLGESDRFNVVAFTTAGSQTDAKHIRAIADRVALLMSKNGIEVFSVNINNPGQHPAASIINTVLKLMGLLAAMSVALSVFLVINTVNAVMGQQVRQIGVMKALGATVAQMVAMYLALVLAFGLIALIVAVPLSALSAYVMTSIIVDKLNADTVPFYLPPLSIILQIGLGVVVPLIGASSPVVGSARMTVRQAITNYGIGASVSRSWIDRLFDRMRKLPRPILFSLRNTFRRKSRLALTLFTLTLGGAIFIGVLSVRDSLFAEVDAVNNYAQADVNAELSNLYPLEIVAEAIKEINGVVFYEGWWTGKLNLLHPDGVNSDQVIVAAPPGQTKLVKPTMLEGRWLRPSDTNAIVVDNHFMKFRPDVKVNDTIVVRINKQNYPFTVIGIFRMGGNSTIGKAYMHLETISEIMETEGQVNSLKLVTDRHDSARQYQISEQLKSQFQEMDIEAALITGEETTSQSRASLSLIILLLLIMAVLIALVGGLGLMGTMSMNVIDRTREIGVLRSIGAVSGSIFQLVTVEGLFVGLISWLFSTIVAIPVASLLGSTLGSTLMNVSLYYRYSFQGVIFWLVIVLILSALASLIPARSAVRLTIRDVLAYE